MASRGPLGVDVTMDVHQAKTAHLASKKVVKETQREPNALETPQNQSTKEEQTLNRAQDVAELKDYVRIATLRAKAPEI